MTMTVTSDATANAGYVRLSDNLVARTCELGDSILIDLDAMNVVVGIEVLRLD